MKLIVAVDINWGIGRKGDLLFRLPSDLKYFREKTSGKTVVMGRKTLESLPSGKPLPMRKNIVLSKKEDLPVYDNLIQVKSVDELLKLLESEKEDVFVIGGGEVYRELINHCDELFITRILADGNADTFFPDMDKWENFRLESESGIMEYQGIKYKFTVYKRI